jgi:hypothetical protein
MRGAFAISIALLACSGHHEAAPTRTGSAAAGSGSARSIAVDAGAPVALGSDGLPIACTEWRAALAKLEACAAFPANARDSLKAEYDAAAKDWAALPAGEKAHLGPICKSGSESVLNGAKATCQW